MAMMAVTLAQRAQHRAEKRAAEAERLRDFTATIAAAAIGMLSDDQLLELREELGSAER